MNFQSIGGDFLWPLTYPSNDNACYKKCVESSDSSDDDEYDCLFCDKSYLSQSALNRHVRDIHNR
jgi:hypothetical protein